MNISLSKDSRPWCWLLTTLLVLSLFCGCAGVVPKSAASYYAGRIYITKESLPNTIQYTDLGKISVESFWYGSTDALYPKLAQKARERGANAIINLEAYLAPAPDAAAWPAPHLEGRAVRISDTARIAKSGIRFRTL